MFTVFYPLLFILGLIIGSFLNVVILRHEKEEGVGGRSYCPSCHKQLHWYELVPLFSYVVQVGRCRGCRTPISAQYPVVEFFTGVLFVGVWYQSGLQTLAFNAPLVLDLAIWSLLIVITVYDLRTMLIPDRFSFLFAALALTSSWLTAGFEIWTFLAGPILFLPFYGLWKYSNGRWMGLGDGKLAWGMGWYLGLLGGTSAVMFAFWVGAAVSLTLIGLQKIFHSFFSTKKFTLSSEVPFGPYLVLGMGIVYFGGYTILACIG